VASFRLFQQTVDVDEAPRSQLLDLKEIPVLSTQKAALA